LKYTTKEIKKVIEMAQTGKNTGNQHAALKEGELGRVQWTESLSGDLLLKFVRYYNIDSELSEKEQRKQVADKARPIFKKAVEELLHD